jgi:hypothetical protein
MSWLSFASMGLEGAGGIFSALQADKAGAKTKKEYYRQAAETERQARYKEKMGLENLEIGDIKQENILGEEIADYTKSGVMVNEGSASDRINALTEKYNWMKVITGRNQAYDVNEMYNEAKLLRKAGKEAARAGKWNMLTGLLIGGAKLGMSAYGLGMFSQSPKTPATIYDAKTMDEAALLADKFLG